MKRVMILGQPGGGKSTLARQMGKILDLPVVHVDLIHWKPGWVERDMAEKIALANAEEAKDRWIFEGGLSQTHDNRLARADTLVVLNMGFLLRVWRVFTRTLISYGHTRPDLPENCPEHFEAEFWLFIWRTRNTSRRRNLERADQARGMGKQVFVLSTRRDVRAFVEGLETARVSGQ